jgi:hypothetical protein
MKSDCKFSYAADNSQFIEVTACIDEVRLTIKDGDKAFSTSLSTDDAFELCEMLRKAAIHKQTELEKR